MYNTICSCTSNTCRKIFTYHVRVLLFNLGKKSAQFRLERLASAVFEPHRPLAVTIVATGCLGANTEYTYCISYHNVVCVEPKLYLRPRVYNGAARSTKLGSLQDEQWRYLELCDRSILPQIVSLRLLESDHLVHIAKLRRARAILGLSVTLSPMSYISRPRCILRSVREEA